MFVLLFNVGVYYFYFSIVLRSITTKKGKYMCIWCLIHFFCTSVGWVLQPARVSTNYQIGPLFINMLLIWATHRALSTCLMSRPPQRTNVELFHIITYFLCNVVMYIVIKSWEIEQFRVVDFLSQTRHQWRGFTHQTPTSSVHIFVRSFLVELHTVVLLGNPPHSYML